MNNLKVSLIQSNLHWENKQANLAMFQEKILAIKEQPDLKILALTMFNDDDYIQSIKQGLNRYKR